MNDEPTDTSTRDAGGGEPGHRVKGEAHQGAIPAKELIRVVIIGVPVMVAAWYFLRWVKGGLG